MSVDYGGLVAPMPLGADEATLGHWKNELGAFAEPLAAEQPGVKISTSVVERINIREAIVDHVKERHADLVVLGTRGRTGLREMLIGTTAEKIVANAPCSILAVKPDSPPEGSD